MPSKLKFYIDKKEKKIYTLKDKINSKLTSSAHYKFVKLKDVEKNN